MRSVLKYPVVAWLRFWARAWLRWHRPLLIAVGGSSGKTSTVAGIVAALAPERLVRSGSGLNSDTGVPLGILGIHVDRYDLRGWINAVVEAPMRALSDDRRCDVYVAEYGIDHPGDMRRLLRIGRPDIAVLTSAGLEHAGYFPQETLGEVLDAIADEELRLLEAAPASGAAVLPGAEPRIAARLDRVKARLVTVGAADGATCEVLRYEVREDGTAADVFYRGVTYPLHLKQPVTRAAVTSVALAACAAAEAGIRFGEALQRIAQAGEVPAGRGRLLRGRDGMLLIDSSYNATPEAMADALALLNDLGGERRRVAILGDMRELGRFTGEAHRALADAVAESADVALLVGPAMSEHLAPLLSGRVTRVEAYPNVTALLEHLDALLEAGDLVLVKGSQNTLFLERVTQRLLAAAGDVAQLPRRGGRWDEVRARAA